MMANSYRHPISTPVPELQGVASIAGRQPFQVKTILMIDEVMDKAGIDQRELARRMKVSEARVSQMLRTDSNMTLRTVDRILNAIAAFKDGGTHA